MFGSATQVATQTQSSLPALQELPGHQEASEAKVKATKKAGRWSKFGKFKVETKKTQETNGTGSTSRRRRKHKPKSRFTEPYKTRNQELKNVTEEAQRKLSTGIEDNGKNRKGWSIYFPLLPFFPVESFTLSSITFYFKFARKLSRKKLLKKPQNKHRQINIQKQITDKPREETIRTTHVSGTEKWIMGWAGSCKQSSPAVMFARLKSNNCYKPGD